MAGADSGDVTDDAAARQAAELAVELSEAGGPADEKRIAARLQGVADRTTATVTNAGGECSPWRGSAARRSAATARRRRGRRPPGCQAQAGHGVNVRHELADRAGGRDGTAAADP